VSRTKPERGFSGRCGELIAILPSPAAPILVVAEVQPYRRVGNGAKLSIDPVCTPGSGVETRCSRRYSANVRLSNLGSSPVSKPLRSASRARAVLTWLVVLCSTDSKLAIRASMNSSISRRKAAAS
jgi:hypothetical protein